jgi:hypothetical protein
MLDTGFIFGIASTSGKKSARMNSLTKFDLPYFSLAFCMIEQGLLEQFQLIMGIYNLMLSFWNTTWRTFTVDTMCPLVY